MENVRLFLPHTDMSLFPDMERRLARLTAEERA